MSDRHIEKSFLYLLALSLLLHLGIYQIVALLPPEQPGWEQKATMVDLTDLPKPPPPIAAKPLPKPKPLPEPKPPEPKPMAKPQLLKPVPIPPVARIPLLPPEKAVPKGAHEAAPKGDRDRDQIVRSAPNLPGKGDKAEEAARSPGDSASPLRIPEKGGKDAARGEGVFRPQQGDRGELAKLFPSARSLEQIEEGYRKKYLDAERGDTRLMDTKDPVIGVFSRRYVQALSERLNSLERHDRKGVGTTILRITVDREGSVIDIRLLYSSGNLALDELAIKASRTVGYVGPLPKKWPHEVYNMIASFIVLDNGISARWRAY